MTALVWDSVGERFYETGVDRGVLYMSGRPAVPWNGLRSVDDTPSDKEVTPRYLDGVRYMLTVTSSEFAGTLKAYTYPDEFLEAEGVVGVINGLFLDNQPPKPFDLCYRTRVGNDVDGNDHGYKIHLLYNMVATPDSKTYASIAEQTDPIEFSWNITGVPQQGEFLSGYRPTSHAIVDSRKISELRLADLEEKLYGGVGVAPWMPTLSELIFIMNNSVGTADLVITDNGDGTWTATSTDGSITMLDADTFQIVSSTATYIDGDTYTISSA